MGDGEGEVVGGFEQRGVSCVAWRMERNKRENEEKVFFFSKSGGGWFFSWVCERNGRPSFWIWFLKRGWCGEPTTVAAGAGRAGEGKWSERAFSPRWMLNSCADECLPPPPPSVLFPRRRRATVTSPLFVANSKGFFLLVFWRRIPPPFPTPENNQRHSSTPPLPLQRYVRVCRESASCVLWQIVTFRSSVKVVP